MKIRNVLFGVMGSAGLLSVLTVSSSVAQVPDYSQFNQLECYQIKDTKDSQVYGLNLESLDQTFLPLNTINKQCQMKRFSRELCVRATTSQMSPPPPSEAVESTNGTVPNSFDYICYKLRCARGSQPAGRPKAAVEDRFGPRDVRVIRIKKVCMPIITK